MFKSFLNHLLTAKKQFNSASLSLLFASIAYVEQKKKVLATTILLLIGGAAIAGTTGGGTTGSEFLNLYNMIFGWATGYLGRSLAIGSFLLGAILGLAGKVILCLSGLGFAIVLAMGPGIINGMFSGLI
jgi:conjugal transfer pilus assembly protein TraA